MRKLGKASVPHNPPHPPTKPQGKLTPPVHPNGYLGETNDATTPQNRLRSGIKDADYT